MQLYKDNNMDNEGGSILRIEPSELPELLDLLLDLLDADERSPICSKVDINFLINFTDALSINIGEDILLEMTAEQTSMFYRIDTHCKSLVN